MKRLWASLCLALGIACVPQSAWALLDSCSVSATEVGFGIYDPFSSSPADSTGTVTVTCFGLLGGIFEVSLSTGQSGTYSARTMASGGNSLNYNLYTNSSRTSIWGDGTGGTLLQSVNCVLVCLGIPNNLTVYGRIPARQDVPAGAYGDSITVTVNF
jgi:spore coat protein U-like protein